MASDPLVEWMDHSEVPYNYPIRQEPPPEEPSPLKFLAFVGILIGGWAAVNWLVLGKHERIPPT